MRKNYILAILLSFNLSCISSYKRTKEEIKQIKSKRVLMDKHILISQKLKKPKAIALVCHGLNLKPLKMSSITDLLNSQGVKTYLVSLTGHRGNQDEMRDVSSGKWLKDLHGAYLLAKKKAEELKVPFYFVGYSLGGVLNEMMMETQVLGEIKYDKVILFAPAISLRSYTYLILLTKALGNRTILPSIPVGDYRANKGTSVAAYDALFTYIGTLDSKEQYKNLNVPTLVFIDPKDELVSHSGLRNLIKSHNLSQWKLVTLNKSGLAKKGRKTYHIIIDKQSLGEDTWNKVKKTISDFLFEQNL